MNCRVIFGLLMLAILNVSFIGQHFKVYAYLLDNANFTKKYCINKDVPESACHGACQMKQLADKEDHESLPIRPELKSVDLFAYTVFTLCFSELIAYEKSARPPIIGLLNSGFCTISCPPPNTV